MSKQSINSILLFLVCGALLFLAFLLPIKNPEKDVCKDDKLPKQETLSTQLLWESLSHQFLTSVQY